MIRFVTLLKLSLAKYKMQKMLGGRPQTCKRCGRVQYVVWHVDDKDWRRFCERTGWKGNKTLCLECFAELCGYVELGKINSDCIVYKSLWE